MAINFRNFQAMHESNIPGRARKIQSDIIMDATFTQDIQYQVGYFFDYYHCSEENRLKLEGFDPEQDSGPIPIDVKFIAHAHKTIEKDDVTMQVQFRPGYQCAVDYYDEMFGKRYNAIHPVGLYVWLRGEDDVYRRWLVVALADYDRNQFPTFEVLKCDEVYRWISDGKYYEFPGVSRSQNSQIMRFIWETIYRKFSNAEKTLVVHQQRSSFLRKRSTSKVGRVLENENHLSLKKLNMVLICSDLASNCKKII